MRMNCVYLFVSCAKCIWSCLVGKAKDLALTSNRKGASSVERLRGPPCLARLQKPHCHLFLSRADPKWLRWHHRQCTGSSSHQSRRRHWASLGALLPSRLVESFCSRGRVHSRVAVGRRGKDGICEQLLKTTFLKLPLWRVCHWKNSRGRKTCGARYGHRETVNRTA